ncbi:hypothetical protein RI367_001900 [Sorochytrium milnesiophthora]
MYKPLVSPPGSPPRSPTIVIRRQRRHLVQKCAFVLLVVLNVVALWTTWKYFTTTGTCSTEVAAAAADAVLVNNNATETVTVTVTATAAAENTATTNDPTQALQPDSPPRSRKLAIVTVVTDKSSYFAQMSMKDKEFYAGLHDYAYIAEPSWVPSRKAVWSKLVSAKRAFEAGYEWVWLLDLDTVITNKKLQAHKLTEAIPEGYDVVISRDCNALNAGSVLLRNTPWTLSYLERLNNTWGHEVSVNEDWQEQAAFIYLDGNDPVVKKHTLLVPQWSFNAYVPESSCQVEGRGWQSGDFVVHFAAMISSQGIVGQRAFYKYIQLAGEKAYTEGFGDKDAETDRWLNTIKAWWQSKGSLTASSPSR